MKFNIPFFWVIPLWVGMATAYFLAAYCYLLSKTGVNMWKVWWQTNVNNLKTERRFAEEIRHHPKWNLAYRMIKWGTPAVILGYIVSVFVYVSHLNPH